MNKDKVISGRQYRSDLTGQIVLATNVQKLSQERFAGVVIDAGESANKVGYYSEDFACSLFEPYEHSNDIASATKETVPFNWEEYQKGGWQAVTRDGKQIPKVHHEDGKNYPLRDYVNHLSWDIKGCFISNSNYDLLMYRITPEATESDDPSTWEYPCECECRDRIIDDKWSVKTVVAYAKGMHYPFITNTHDDNYNGYRYARRIPQEEISVEQAEALLKELKGIDYKIVTDADATK